MPSQPPPDFKKPSILFHGSSNRTIKEFLPRAKGVRDPNEGPVVFASLEKAAASIFMHPSHDEIKSTGRMNGVWYCLIGNPKRYLEQDQGGAIYTLPSNNFTFNPNKGLGYQEWTSKTPVKPLSKKEYASCLDAMLQLGVQVYMQDTEKLQAFRNMKADFKLSYLCTVRSENHRLGINVKFYEE